MINFHFIAKSLVCGLVALLISFGATTPPVFGATPEGVAPFLRIVIKEDQAVLDAREVGLRRTLSELIKNSGLEISMPDFEDRSINGHYEADTPSNLFLQLAKRFELPLTGTGAADMQKNLSSAPRKSDNAPPVALMTMDKSARKTAPSAARIDGKNERPQFRPHQLIVQWKKETTDEQRQALHQKLGCTQISNHAGQNLALIKLPDTLDEDEAAGPERS